MTDQQPEVCANCPTWLCPGPAGHALHTAILAVPMSRRRLAAALHADAEDSDFTDCVWMMRKLRSLPMKNLEHLLAMVGYSALTATPILHTRGSGTRTVREPDTAILTAAVLDAGSRGVLATDLATRLAWPLADVMRATHELRAQPPPGIRLHTTPEGHLTLRPDPLCLLPSATARTATRPDTGATPDDTEAEPGSTDTNQRSTPQAPRLELGQAAALWAVWRGTSTFDSDRHLDDLEAAGLINRDVDPPRVCADVTYSLQWFSDSTGSM